MSQTPLYHHNVTYARGEDDEPCSDQTCSEPAEYECADCGELACDQHLQELTQGFCPPRGPGGR